MLLSASVRFRFLIKVFFTNFCCSKKNLFPLRIISDWFKKHLLSLPNILRHPEAYSEPCQTYKLQRFLKIVHGS